MTGEEQYDPVPDECGFFRGILIAFAMEVAIVLGLVLAIKYLRG